ncbi:DUF308 domain-containing protein [Candidatus Woesearchaeota archaeon]|jgi:hypothetical protein|nr:DUF308 domain-containing protein [Candidatus Woesearchaeota archaeon]MBT4114069.1 DUF308 domain-containing protein [Candidatus Woesearchaeota archaeon]MBT4248613.1 DUF308 domain-containing protein [Candidatus Woesearchaeota archaeon]
MTRHRKSRSREHKSRHKHRSDYNKHVDRLLKKNISKLKDLGRYNERNRKDPYGRTDGERQVARTLRRLHIRYIPEYYIGKLRGDSKSYRISDFYLPREKIHIEFLGNWNTSERHRNQYKYKMAMYHENHIKHINIFPNQLFNITWVLKRELRRVKEGKPVKRGGLISVGKKKAPSRRISSLFEDIFGIVGLIIKLIVIGVFFFGIGGMWIYGALESSTRGGLFYFAVIGGILFIIAGIYLIVDNLNL